MCHFAWQFADIARHPKGVTELHIMPKCKWQMPMCFNIANQTSNCNWVGLLFNYTEALHYKLKLETLSGKSQRGLPLGLLTVEIRG